MRATILHSLHTISTKDLKSFHTHNQAHTPAPRAQKAPSSSNNPASLEQKTASLPSSRHSQTSRAKSPTSTESRTPRRAYRSSPPSNWLSWQVCSFGEAAMAEVCSCKEELQEHTSTAACCCVCWSLKVLRARTGCGTFQFHGEDREGVCAGRNHLWALTLPGDVGYGFLAGNWCSPWLEFSGLGGWGEKIAAVHMSC